MRTLPGSAEKAVTKPTLSNGKTKADSTFFILIIDLFCAIYSHSRTGATAEVSVMHLQFGLFSRRRSLALKTFDQSPRPARTPDRQIQHFHLLSPDG